MKSRSTRTSGRYPGVRWTGYSWQASYVDSSGARRSQSGFGSAKAAADFRLAKTESVRRDKIRRRHLPDYVDGTDETTTLGDLFEPWLVEQKSRRPLADGTESKYRTYFRTKLAPAFGEMPVATITPDRITEWQAGLVATFSTDTAQTSRWMLGVILELARKRGVVAVNPIHDVLPIAATKRDLDQVGTAPRRILTPAEDAAFVESIDARYRLLLVVGVATGLRPGEIYGLRRSDFSVEENGFPYLSVSRQLVTVNGQPRLTTRLKGEPRSTASRRTIPIYPEVFDEMEAHVERHGTGRLGDLFTSPEGDSFSPSNFRRRIWRPAYRGAGLSIEGLADPVPYTLRHTHASRLLAAGVAPAEVAKRLGHKRQTTTLDFYSHPTRGGDLDLLDAVRPSIRASFTQVFAENVVPIATARAKSAGTA